MASGTARGRVQNMYVRMCVRRRTTWRPYFKDRSEFVLMAIDISAFKMVAREDPVSKNVGDFNYSKWRIGSRYPRNESASRAQKWLTSEGQVRISVISQGHR